MLIYKLNFSNNKSYIGQAQEISRIKDHKYEAYNKKYDAYNTYLSKAIRKYGWDDINSEILEDNINDIDILNEREIFNIEKYNTFMPNGYNMTRGGMGKVGYICSEETKEKIRKKHIGKKLSLETIQILREMNKGEKNHFFGKTHTDETKKILSQKNKGYKHTEEAKEKSRLSHLGERNHMFGKHLSKEAKQKLRIANLGKRHSEQSKIKMSISRTGTKRTEETKRKMSESARLAHLKRKSLINTLDKV